MKRWFILLLFLGVVLSGNDVNAAVTCRVDVFDAVTGLDTGVDEIINNCVVDCDAIGADLNNCGLFRQNACIGPDTFGFNSQGDSDGTGDVRFSCRGDINDGSGISKCWGTIVYGDPAFITGSQKGGICFENAGVFSDLSCYWLKGSLVPYRQYCDPIEKVLKQNDNFNGLQCIHDGSPGFFINKGGFSLNYPDYDTSGGQGFFCPDYCVESSSGVIDRDKCSAFGTNYSSCPSIRYDNFCSGIELNKYTCDSLSIDPTDGYWSGDGRDVRSTTSVTNCFQQGTPSTCDSSCGSLSGSALDICQLGTGWGECSGVRSSAKCGTTTASNLDTSQSVLESFYSSCTSQGETWGTINWSEPGDISLGEYKNVIGRTDTGLIPSLIDTVIFMESGRVNKVLTLKIKEEEYEEDHDLNIKVTIFKKSKPKIYNKVEYKTKIKRLYPGSIIPIKEILIGAINKNYIKKGEKIVCIEDGSMGTGYKGTLFIFDVDEIFF